jgi:hypothetical protein
MYPPDDESWKSSRGIWNEIAATLPAPRRPIVGNRDEIDPSGNKSYVLPMI